MQPLDLIETARVLTRRTGRGRPKDARLRRAVSTAYYAMFHCLALTCADALAGKVKGRRNQEAWLRTYRALDHGYAKKRCANQQRIRNFPGSIQKFAGHFINMQQLRIDADYNPLRDFALSEVVHKIDEAEDVINEFRKAPIDDLRAFAIHILFRFRERQD